MVRTKATERLLAVFSNKKITAKFALYSLAAVIILGVPAALVPNPVFHRMIQSTALDYVFLASTSLLAGLYLAIPSASCAPDGKAWGGSVLGILSFACPTCDLLLVLLLGPAFLLSVFDPLRPIIGLASVAVLGYAVSQKLAAVPLSPEHH